MSAEAAQARRWTAYPPSARLALVGAPRSRAPAGSAALAIASSGGLVEGQQAPRRTNQLVSRRPSPPTVSARHCRRHARFEGELDASRSSERVEPVAGAHTRAIDCVIQSRRARAPARGQSPGARPPRSIAASIGRTIAAGAHRRSPVQQCDSCSRISTRRSTSRSRATGSPGRPSLHGRPERRTEPMSHTPTATGSTHTIAPIAQSHDTIAVRSSACAGLPPRAGAASTGLPRSSAPLVSTGKATASAGVTGTAIGTTGVIVDATGSASRTANAASNSR